MSNKRLVALTEEQVRRLMGSADSYEDGITVEEAEHVLSATRGEIALRNAHCRFCEPLVAKLRTFTREEP